MGFRDFSKCNYSPEKMAIRYELEDSIRGIFDREISKTGKDPRDPLAKMMAMNAILSAVIQVVRER